MLYKYFRKSNLPGKIKDILKPSLLVNIRRTSGSHEQPATVINFNGLEGLKNDAYTVNCKGPKLERPPWPSPARQQLCVCSYLPEVVLETYLQVGAAGVLDGVDIKGAVVDEDVGVTFRVPRLPPPKRARNNHSTILFYLSSPKLNLQD